jgi:hypothetical protein
MYRKYKYFFPAMQMNVRLMHQAVAKLTGTTRNFKNFCKVDKSKGLNKTLFERSVYEAYIQPLGRDDFKPSKEEQETGSHLPDSLAPQPTDFFVLIIHGKAFLWHQVRCIMGLLYHVGLGLEPVDIIDKLSDPDNILPDKGRPVYTMAAELPLVLVDCTYPDSTFTWLGSSPLDPPLASKYTGQKKVKLSRPALPKSETFDPQWTNGVMPLVHLWKEHQTRATQILSLLHDMLPQQQCSSAEAGSGMTDTTEATERVGRLMHELIRGDDPMAGWPIQCGSQNVHLMSGSGRGKYTPILERDRTAGERERAGQKKKKMAAGGEVEKVTTDISETNKTTTN